VGIPGDSPFIARKGLTLAPFRALRELELEISFFSEYDKGLNLISSITSTDIEKIIFSRSGALDRPVSGTFWTQLDHLLVELSERPRYKLMLEVEFRGTWNIEGKDFDRKKTYLPRFVKKGRMTVWDGWNSWHPIYCSGERG
jgi:hypothetical protein